MIYLACRGVTGNGRYQERFNSRRSDIGSTQTGTFDSAAGLKREIPVLRRKSKVWPYPLIHIGVTWLHRYLPSDPSHSYETPSYCSRNIVMYFLSDSMQQRGRRVELNCAVKRPYGVCGDRDKTAPYGEGDRYECHEPSLRLRRYELKYQAAVKSNKSQHPSRSSSVTNHHRLLREPSTWNLMHERPLRVNTTLSTIYVATSTSYYSLAVNMCSTRPGPLLHRRTLLSSDSSL